VQRLIAEELEGAAAFDRGRRVGSLYTAVKREPALVA
jgi:hypothetical protein